MNLSDILARDNAQVQLAEATALEILAGHAGDAREMFDAAKRELRHIPTSELGIFISPAASKMFFKGSKEATRSLFDAYATIVFSHVRDAEDFIALLDPIAERVREKLSVLDRQEAELCVRAWVRRARERACVPASPSGAGEPESALRPTILSTSSSATESYRPVGGADMRPAFATVIQRAWLKFSGLWRRGRPASADQPKAAVGRTAVIESPISAPAPETSKTESAPAQPEAAMSATENGPDRSEMVDAFLLQCNREAGADFRVTKEHISRAVGHKTPRQFQYWQSRSDKATIADNENFRRILGMRPADFILLLKKKGIVS